jgi:molecular chaperone GrpE
MTWKIYRHPSDPTGTPIEDEATEGKQGTEAEGTPPDPVAELEGQLAAAKTESEQWRDRFLRKAAEFENYRKRMEKEKGESALLAKSSVLMEFLAIVDACERALASFEGAKAEGTSLDEYRQWVELLYKQVLDTLHRVGVVPIEAQGRDFDPHLHEALVREESSQHEENTVIEELRRGYLFKDRLLRPAQVKVATRPSGENPSKS